MSSENSRKPYLFFSHSSADKPLVRKLLATLAAAGIDGFLDERDIHVGENIPARLYSELASATHIVYVVSKASIASRWVNEELSVAKMREQEEHGCRILPLLADDVELPMAVRHIKYADFRSWRVAEHYMTASQSLLNALGFAPPAFDNADVEFYLSHITAVEAHYRTAIELHTFIDAAMLAPRGAEPFSGHDPEDLRDISRWMVKIYLDSIDIRELRRFTEFMDGLTQAQAPPKMARVISETRELLKLIKHGVHISEKDLERAMQHCRQIWATLGAIRDDGASVLAPAAALARTKLPSGSAHREGSGSAS